MSSIIMLTLAECAAVRPVQASFERRSEAKPQPKQAKATPAAAVDD